MNSDKTALITGASSGIGRDLAKVLGENHYNLILVARNRDALESIAAELHQKYLVKIEVISCDLSDRLAVQKMINSLKETQQVIDVLVNNAGFGVEGAFSETDLIENLSLIDLNIGALVQLTKAFLPQMVARGSGKILQISSTAGFQPGPFYSTYFASKAFITSFSQALSGELRGSGVSVTTVCPGPTHTGFAKRLGNKPSLFESGIPIANSRKIAEYSYRAMEANKSLAIPGIFNKILNMFSKLLPRSFVLFIMVSILKKSEPIQN